MSKKTTAGRMTGFFFQDYYADMLTALTKEELGTLVLALSRYHGKGEMPELEGATAVAFNFIRADIDRIEKNYARKCAANKSNRKRRENTTCDQEDDPPVILNSDVTNADETERNTTNDNESKRNTTNDNETERNITNDNETERNVTNDNEMPQVKVKEKVKEKIKVKDKEKDKRKETVSRDTVKKAGDRARFFSSS